MNQIYENHKRSEAKKLTVPVVNHLESNSEDDIHIYVGYDKGTWCVAAYGIITEPFKTPQEALECALEHRKNVLG